MEVPFLEIEEPFDVESFGTLGRMGLLSGFSPLGRVLFIDKEVEPLVVGSAPYKTLKAQGWKFIVLVKTREA
jgi:hypothetical protein